MITWYLIALDWWLIWLRPDRIWADRDDHPHGGGTTVVSLDRWRRDHPPPTGRAA